MMILRDKPSNILHRKANNVKSALYFSMAFPNETPPIGLHLGMFVPSVNSQMTKEQMAKWEEPIENFRIIGTYAQTELGHGELIQSVWGLLFMVSCCEALCQY